MQQLFDYFGYPEIPPIVLCNPSKDELFSLGLAYETKITLRFNALSDFEFTFPKSIDGMDSIIEAYDLIQNKRLVLVEGYGYFQVVDCQEDLDGSVPVKHVKCQSLEVELIQKRIVGYSGTKQLYDPISPAGTVLGDMLSFAPTWSVGTIDAELIIKYRTFSVSDTNVYNFLMNEVSKAFDCVFIYDTVNKTISAKTTENATVQTDIFMSFDNLIEKAQFSEKSDEIVTALSVYGAGDLNIRLVNPLGTNTIYNFDYYANTEWMSSGLVTAVQAWKSLVNSRQAPYADLLTILRTQQSDLIILQGDLSDLQNELSALQTVQSTRIQDNQDYSDIYTQIVAKTSQIASKNVEITNKQTQINATKAQLVAINDEVKFQNNFSPSQLIELNAFIYENTYQNQNILLTDRMTEVEVQDAAQDLYDQGVSVLERVSQPRYEISLDSVNYIAIEDFSVFTNQTNVGIVATVELKDGTYAETVLLELSFQFDDPQNFRMTFSNRLRLDGEGYKYSDLMGQVVETGSQVSFNSAAWANWNNEYKDDVSTFITSSLDASLNRIISNSNQEITIDQTGLRGRRVSGNGYEDIQVWLTNNVLAFSDDAFQTAKLALGRLTINGGEYFGLVGDYIIGHILAGNQLQISNENNNFLLNATGAFLNNATLTISSTNSKIFLDPVNGIKIQQNVGGTWTDRFKVDGTGNVVFSGTLSAASGSFSGSVSASSGSIGSLIIDSNGLRTPDGVNFLRGNGDLKWGALSIVGGSATFSGNIQANKLLGAVSYSQLTDIPFGKIVSGTAATGTSLNWPGGVIVRSSNAGYISIQAPNEIEISALNSFLLIDSGGLSAYAPANLTLNADNYVAIESSNMIIFQSDILSRTKNGSDEGFGVTGTINPRSYTHFKFINGILVDYY